MKLAWILDGATSALDKVKLKGKRRNPDLMALDRGVLSVAILLAALDGTILPEEYATFEALAKRCRGGSARKNVRALLDATLHDAGRLMAMAQTGAYDDKERLAAFLDAAKRMLPFGFSHGSLADLRRAFALWVAVGASDGEFSPLERAAVRLLERQYATSQRLGQGLIRLFEPNYLEKVDRIVRDLADPAKRAQAEADLEQLVGTVRIVNSKGDVIVKVAAAIAVKIAVVALIAI